MKRKYPDGAMAKTPAYYKHNHHHTSSPSSSNFYIDTSRAPPPPSETPSKNAPALPCLNWSYNNSHIMFTNQPPPPPPPPAPTQPQPTPRFNMPSNNQIGQPVQQKPQPQRITPVAPPTPQDASSATASNCNKKRRRHSKTSDWKREDAIRALEAENVKSRKTNDPHVLILKFPDPDINKEIVSGYSPFIDAVHFHQPSAARFCFVQLKVNADVEKVIEEISNTKFGLGKIIAEKKTVRDMEKQNLTPEEVDPHTLYVGNLPLKITVQELNVIFPNAKRIEVGYPRKVKNTRYAFVRYLTVDEAIEAYKQSYKRMVGSREMIVRFRRQKGNTSNDSTMSEPNEIDGREDAEHCSTNTFCDIETISLPPSTSSTTLHEKVAEESNPIAPVAEPEPVQPEPIVTVPEYTLPLPIIAKNIKTEIIEQSEQAENIEIVENVRLKEEDREEEECDDGLETDESEDDSDDGMVDDLEEDDEEDDDDDYSLGPNNANHNELKSEDIKPRLESLIPHDTSRPVHIMQHDLKPSPEQMYSWKANSYSEHTSYTTASQKKRLDDLFNALNPDDDSDF